MSFERDIESLSEVMKRLASDAEPYATKRLRNIGISVDPTDDFIKVIKDFEQQWHTKITPEYLKAALRMWYDDAYTREEDKVRELINE